MHFKINLNKYGELKQQEEAERKIFLRFTGSFFVLTIFLYILLLTFNYSLNSKYNNRLSLLRSIESEIKNYQTSGEALSARDLERLAQTSVDRVFWSRKLVALSKDISNKIAVTHFSYKNGVFSLFGITKADPEEKEYDLIDDFIRTLKNNEDINIDFPEIKFVRSTRDKEKDAEIIRFQIDAMGQNQPTRTGRR